MNKNSCIIGYALPEASQEVPHGIRNCRADSGQKKGVIK